MAGGRLLVSRANAFIDKARAYQIFINGVEYSKIKNNDTVELSLEPGKYSIQLKVDWMTSNTINLILNHDEEIKFECGNRSKKLLFHFLNKKEEYLFIREIKPNEVTHDIPLSKEAKISILVVLVMLYGFAIVPGIIFSPINTVGKFMYVTLISGFFTVFAVTTPVLMYMNLPSRITISGSTLLIQRKMGSFVYIPRSQVYKLIRFPGQITKKEHIAIYYDVDKPDDVIGFESEYGTVIWNWYYADN